MQWKLFANLAETAGDRTVEIETDDPEPTVRDALEALLDRHPDLEPLVLDESGDLQDHINLLKNGSNVSFERGLDTAIDEDDELALFPPVTGG